MPSIPVKLITPTATAPTRANPSDAGLDLYADILVDLHIMPGDFISVPTGVCVAMQSDECGQIWPRSGMATRCGIDVLAGLIDPGYRGVIKVCLINHGCDRYVVKHGDKIAQLVIVPFSHCTPIIVDELPEADRGDKGFGSSGK